MNWNRYPLLKLLIPFVLGILFVSSCDFNSDNLLKIIIILSVSLLCSFCLRLSGNATLHLLSLFLLCASAFFWGAISTSVALSPPRLPETQKVVEKSRFFTAQILEKPTQKEKSVKVVANLLTDSSGNTVNLKAVLYLQKCQASQNLKLGDLLCFNAQLKPIAPPNNPNSFDNQQYLKRKNIYFTSYVPSSNWFFLSETNAHPLRRLAGHVQQYFSKVFSDNGLEGNEYAIITAVLLGNSETMTSELRSSFASAGVSHILCVSGMHVGIIFMIINFLLKPLDYSRRAQWLKALLLVLAIWSYALITGLSPSVKRAATMFTFVIVGGLLRRPVNVFHSLFASLFILLVINPLLLFEVGFQMSYLAVFGIVIIQPIIKNIYQPRTRVGNYFWELAAVSIAAQLSTFPLSIYYFGQFPNYFLLANLSVIALSFIIVVSGVILLAISWLPLISSLVGKLLSSEIKLLNGIVVGIDSLPGAVTENISVSPFQVFLLYTMVFTVFLCWVKKTPLSRYLALCSLLFYGFTLVYARLQESKIQEITFYAMDKMSAVGFNNHGVGIVFMDSLDRKSVV